MKSSSVFAFVTGVSVGSVVSSIKIGKTICKNDIAKQALADIIYRKIDDILFGGKTPEYKVVKTKQDRLDYTQLNFDPPKHYYGTGRFSGNERS